MQKEIIPGSRQNQAEREAAVQARILAMNLATDRLIESQRTGIYRIQPTRFEAAQAEPGRLSKLGTLLRGNAAPVDVSRQRA